MKGSVANSEFKDFRGFNVTAAYSSNFTLSEEKRARDFSLTKKLDIEG